MPNGVVNSRLLVRIARIILWRKLRVGAAKQTAASHGAESLLRVSVAFLSFHQRCQLRPCFWVGNPANQCGFRVAKSPPTVVIAEHW